MNTLKHEDSSGIFRKVRGIIKRGEMKMERTWGVKMQNYKNAMGNRSAALLPSASHLGALGRSLGGWGIASR